jgi:TolA-binding protein
MKLTYKILILVFHFSISTAFAQSIADKFTSGMEAYHLKLYSDANQIFEDIIENYGIEDELYASARYYSADALLKMGKSEESAAGFEFISNHVIWSNFREESLFNLGMIYFDAGRFSLSRKNLVQLIGDYPHGEYTGSAYYWIGESYAEEDRLDDAVDFLLRAIEDRPSNTHRDHSIYALAGVYERQEDYNNAVKYYDQLLSYYPNSSLANQAQLRIGICYFKLNDYYTSILELNDPSLSGLSEKSLVEGLYLLANSYYQVEEYENAVKSYSEIIEKFPSSSVTRNTHYGLAWSYFQLQKYSDAYNVFNYLSEGTDSLAVKSFIWKGEARRYSGNYSEAAGIFGQFLKLYPSHYLAAIAEYQIGVINFEQNKFDVANRYLTNATSSDDPVTRAKAFTLIGEMELQKQNYIKAKGHFEPAVRITKTEADVHQRALLGLGITLYHLQDFDNAIEYLHEAEDINPGFEPDKISFYLAESYFAIGKFQEALNRYNSIETNDINILKQIIYSKGYCHFNVGSYDNAAYQFSDYLQKYPNDKRATDAKLRLADSYFGSKNFIASSRIFKELFQSKSFSTTDPYTFYQYAQALYKSGESSEAIREFQNLQQNFPTSKYAQNSLYTVGWIKFQQGDFSEAINDYKNVLRVYKRSSLSPLIYYSIGDAYFNLEKYDSAIVNYQRVISHYPSSEYVFDAINGIQYSYVSMGKPNMAVDLIDNFIEKNPKLKFSDQIFFKKGEIYYSQRDYKNAKISYQEFVTKFSKSSFVPEAYYWLGKSAENLNELDEASFYFKKVFESYPNSEPAAVSVIELGNIYETNEDYKSAIDLFNSAASRLKDSPRLPEILFMKGQAYLKMDDLQNAYGTFSELALYHQQSLFADKAKFEMGLIDLAVSRFENADDLFLDIAENRTDDMGAKAQYYYGVSLYEQQKYTESISALVRVRTVYSNYHDWLSRAYLLMGDCYAKLDDTRKAEEMYRTVIARNKGGELGEEARKKINELK